MILPLLWEYRNRNVYNCYYTQEYVCFFQEKIYNRLLELGFEVNTFLSEHRFNTTFLEDTELVVKPSCIYIQQIEQTKSVYLE